MNKTLILLRHGHREKNLELGGRLDNGLSKKGERQAFLIYSHFKKMFPDQKPFLVSSPRKRCLETLEPLAQGYGLSVTTLDYLNEGGDVDNKIEDFKSWWEGVSHPIVVACSHGDILPLLVWKLTGESAEFRKGAWAEILERTPKHKLKEVIQDLENEG